MNSSASTSGMRVVDDMKHVSESLLRLLVHKKTITKADANAALKMSLRKLADTREAEGAVLYMRDPNRPRIRLKSLYFAQCSYGNDTARFNLLRERVDQLEELILPLDKSVAGQSMLRKESISICTAEAIEPFYEPVEWAPEFSIRSLIAAPIVTNKTPIGCVQLINKTLHAGFDEEDARIVKAVAYYMSKAIERLQNPDAQLGERDLAMCLSKLTNLPFLEVEPNLLDVALLKLVGEENITRYQILPLRRIDGKKIAAAMTSPHERYLVDDFELVTGLKIVEQAVTTFSNVRRALPMITEGAHLVSEAAENVELEYGGEIQEVLVGEEENENSRPIIELANRIIEDANTARASDIHIEPQMSKLVVRYRVDGICRPRLSLPMQAHRALVSRIKIMSELDITERRMPQDGRISFRKFNPKYDLDLRVSVAPMAWGESVVMRLLDRTRSHLPLSELGFSPYNLERYRKVIREPFGMILHTGPTGSGKSMTLFAALNEINAPDTKILTAEDPVEYMLHGINQLQVKKDIGLTFANALRCFLRQDPDVILVGEIRDRETAEIATEAALTGHLLFSTLHTNDAPSTITRLGELKVEPFLIATTLKAICAQRLLRRLCRCKAKDKPTTEESQLLARAKDDSATEAIFRANNCDQCEKTGYRGRIGIHELFVVTESLRHLIGVGASSQDLKRKAREEGMRTLFEDSMEKVKAGVTTIQEALATASSNEEN